MQHSRVALIGITALLVAGCGSAKPGRVVTVTVDAPSSTRATPATSSARPTHVAPSHLTKLPGPCDTLLTDYLVSQAIGGQQFRGKDVFVVGQKDPGIGRIGYLNCRYGVTGTGAAEKAEVEIGVSLYGTAAQAAKRIPATVDDYTAHGATPSDVIVAGQPGRLLTGGSGAGYTLPVLVVASGQRTVAVTIDPAVVSAANVRKDAVAVAALALERTAG